MPVRLLYVCNFSNIHARSLVAHFASRPRSWSVTVLSSDPADPMDNVRLLQLKPGRGLRRALTRGRIARIAYRLMDHVPGFLVRMRSIEFLIQVHLNRKHARALVEREDFDLIHALRLQPEAIIAAGIKERWPEIPFFLTTWGQDLVVYAERGGPLARMSRKALRLVDTLLPDNDRDERLARQQFGLKSTATTTVIPATGGIRPEDMPDEFAVADIPGYPRLLSMRGYENAYIRLRVMIKAFAQFLETYPDARFYIDVNAQRRIPERDDLVKRWIRDAGVEGHVSLLHLDRQGALSYMARCDLYVSATVSDGLPMSLIEALWYGQLVVVHKLESLERIEWETRGIQFYEEIDPCEIANAWCMAAELVNGRTARRHANRAAIRQKYDRTTNLDQLGKQYSKAITPKVT